MDENEVIQPELQQDDAPPQGDVEEYEYEGEKYSIPSKIKHALESSKSESLAREEAFKQQRAEHDRYLDDIATIRSAESRLKEYESLDWDNLEPAQAQKLWVQYQRLQQARDNAAKDIETKQATERITQGEAAQKALVAGQQKLAKEIPGWGPELARSLHDFGVKTLGFSAQELSAVTDPRIVKMLHAAYTNSGGQTHTTTNTIKPVTTLGGSGPASKDPSRMSTDDWIKHRYQQLSKGR